MSILNNDAVRLLVDCFMSGMAPDTADQVAARAEEKRQYQLSRVGLCPSRVDFYDDTFECDLAEGHDPPHVYEDTDGTPSMRLTWLPGDEVGGDDDD